MSSIVACPKCSSLVLSDTVQCPSCNEVLIPEKAAELATPAAPKQEVDSSSELECQDCGVMLRAGVVRCWNCGSFTRRDVEERFMAMQQEASGIIFSEDATKEETVEEVEEEVAWDDETDFTLADDVEMYDAPEADDETDGIPMLAMDSDDVDMELSPLPELEMDESTPDTVDAEADEEGQTYGLADDGGSDSEEQETSPAPKSSDEEDILFEIAMREEAERKSRLSRREEELQRQTARVLKQFPDGRLSLLGPCGACQITVQSHHQGMGGKCPRCHATFRVPKRTLEVRTIDSSTAGGHHGAQRRRIRRLSVSQKVGKYQHWLEDVRLHRVEQKEQEKLEANSLKSKAFVCDLGFSADGIAITLLVTKAGDYEYNDKKLAKPRKEARQLLLDVLKIEQKAADDPKPELPKRAEQVLKRLSLGDVSRFRIVYPASEARFELFDGEPVWGEGIIAVQITMPEMKEDELVFLSFTLSQFREFSRLLKYQFGYGSFTLDSKIPATDQIVSKSCCLTREEFDVVDHTQYYVADPLYELKHLGWECVECKIPMTEEARADKNIGGKGAKNIAKTKCPSCGKPMGEGKLYEISKKPKEFEDAPAEKPAVATES